MKRVVHTALTSPEPKVIFESHDQLLNLGIMDSSGRLFIYWQEEYMERRETYFCVSLDSGRTFSDARPLDFKNDLLGIAPATNKLLLLTCDDQLIQQFTDLSREPGGTGLLVKEITFSPLPAPQIIAPQEKAVLQGAGVELVYVTPTTAPFICRIDLSQSTAEPQSFEALVISSSRETARYVFPTELADGDYELKIQTFDGVNHSLQSQSLSFRVDNTPPRLLSLEAARKEKELTLLGEVDESPAWLTINNQSVTLAGSFECRFTLAPGNNLFTLILTDEAGNSSISTREVFYDPALPELSVLKPTESEWFRPESVILIEVDALDLQGDIEDGAQAQIAIHDQVLEDTLIFDQEEKKLFGFITLPSHLTEGKHSGRITLADRSGNTGETFFDINIDGSPPEIGVQPQASCYTNSQTSISIPAQDIGAGIDPAGTLVTIAGASLEGTISVEAQKIVVTTSFPLPEGTYEAELTSRDRIGNVGETITFDLVVDTTPPILTLYGSHEPTTRDDKMTVQGMVIENNLKILNIYINQEKIESRELEGEAFTKEIQLLPGANDILIEAKDGAGNKDSAGLSVFADLASPTLSLIQSCLNAPNPFSPSNKLPGAFSVNGKGMVFSYSLSRPADIKIRIYDITGTLIWTRSIDQTASGVTAWDGVDVFGRTAGNGIYPYVFTAKAGGATEVRRGKIIVYQ